MNTYAYRRGTIFWALTLIGVGTIFLYQNFNPEVHPWHIIARFWPILIIFWGLSKLVDYLQSRARPEEAPRTWWWWTVAAMWKSGPLTNPPWMLP